MIFPVFFIPRIIYVIFFLCHIIAMSDIYSFYDDVFQKLYPKKKGKNGQTSDAGEWKLLHSNCEFYWYNNIMG